MSGLDNTPSVSPSTNKATPDDRKGPWSADEDQLLRAQHPDKKETKWADVAKKVPGRSAKQCRERWEQNLKAGINKGPITDDEALIICQMVGATGNSWAKIARALENRTDNTVKNWYNGMLQKSKSRNYEQPRNMIEAHFFQLRLEPAGAANGSPQMNRPHRIHQMFQQGFRTLPDPRGYATHLPQNIQPQQHFPRLHAVELPRVHIAEHQQFAPSLHHGAPLQPYYQSQPAPADHHIRTRGRTSFSSFGDAESPTDSIFSQAHGSSPFASAHTTPEMFNAVPSPRDHRTDPNSLGAQMQASTLPYHTVESPGCNARKRSSPSHDDGAQDVEARKRRSASKNPMSLSHITN